MFGTVLLSIKLNVGSRFLQSGFLLLQKRLHGHYFQPRVYRWLHDLEKWNRTGKGKKLCLVKCMALNVRWFFRCKDFGDHILKASNSYGFGSTLSCLEYWKSNQILWPSAVPEPSQSRTSSLTLKQGEMWIEQLSEETQWSNKKKRSIRLPRRHCCRWVPVQRIAGNLLSKLLSLIYALFIARDWKIVTLCEEGKGSKSVCVCANLLFVVPEILWSFQELSNDMFLQFWLSSLISVKTITVF